MSLFELANFIFCLHVYSLRPHRGNCAVLLWRAGRAAGETWRWRGFDGTVRIRNAWNRVNIGGFLRHLLYRKYVPAPGEGSCQVLECRCLESEYNRICNSFNSSHFIFENQYLFHIAMLTIVSIRWYSWQSECWFKFFSCSNCSFLNCVLLILFFVFFYSIWSWPNLCHIFPSRNLVSVEFFFFSPTNSQGLLLKIQVDVERQICSFYIKHSVLSVKGSSFDLSMFPKGCLLMLKSRGTMDKGRCIYFFTRDLVVCPFVPRPSHFTEWIKIDARRILSKRQFLCCWSTYLLFVYSFTQLIIAFLLCS